MASERNRQGLLTENQLTRMVHESTLAVRVEDWRLARLASVAKFEIPDRVLDGPKVVLHILPLSLFDMQPESIELGCLTEEERGRVVPLFSTGFSTEYNSDGFLAYEFSGYLQVFRFGGIESARQLRADSPGVYRLYVDIEVELLRCMRRYVQLLWDHRITAPLVVMLSVTGVAGATAIYGSNSMFPPQRRIKDERLLSPRVLITDRSVSLPEAMRPILDMLCGAAGLPGSPLYDQSGKWKGPEL